MQKLTFKSLGKFEVAEEIGRGSMGTVFLAHDPFSSRDVAIKVANPEQLQDPTQGKRYRKMFFHEAKVAGRLRHPNIVQVYDASLEDDFCYIVMEYIPGDKTLYEHIKPGHLLPLEDVVRIAFKCARALEYAHRNSVIHRDIKPRNILLTDDNDVKIADFSIALLFEPEATETQVHGYVGSPLYMSPEQILEAPLSNTSDLFSLGVTIYELLTGKHPFAGDSLPSIIQKITEQPHVPVCELRQDVPPVLGHIVDRCLMKKSTDRYKTGLDLAADLSLVYSHIELLEGKSPTTTSATWSKIWAFSTTLRNRKYGRSSTPVAGRNTIRNPRSSLRAISTTRFTSWWPARWRCAKASSRCMCSDRGTVSEKWALSPELNAPPVSSPAPR